MSDEFRSIAYKNRIGRDMQIAEVRCLCSHAAHRNENCPRLGCGCIRYRPENRPEPPDAAA
jgi:hypothetical protein